MVKCNLILSKLGNSPMAAAGRGDLSDSYDKDQGTGLRRLHTAEPLARPISAPGLGLCLLLITPSISILIGTNCWFACRGPW